MSEYAELVKRLKGYRTTVRMDGIKPIRDRDWSDSIAAILALEAQVATLRTALEWYAAESTWTALGHPQIDYDTKPILRDNGRRAREALGMLQ